MGTLAKKSTAAIVKTTPRQEVALLMQKDSESYWVRGYEFFDPDFEHSTRAGRQGLKTKRTRSGCVWLIMQEQIGKPSQYEESRISIVHPDKHYFTFQEVFGSTEGMGAVVINAVLESDDEDLMMGVDGYADDDENGTD